MASSEPWIRLGRSFEASLDLHPRLRGQGLGSRLVKFAEDRILRISPNVFMFVSSFNDGARRLYHRLGYQVVGELTDYIVEGHSEILLRKTTARSRDSPARGSSMARSGMSS